MSRFGRIDEHCNRGDLLPRDAIVADVKPATTAQLSEGALPAGSVPTTQWRCLLVVAAPGYGKTTALRAWLPAAASRWYPYPAVRGLAAGELPDPPPPAASGRRWVVVDDLPTLPTAEARALLDWVESLPDGIGVALASRSPLDAPVSRGLGQGWLRPTLPADLALSPARVAAVLRDDYDLRDAGLPAQVHAVTAGWPALVRLAAETLVRQSTRAGPPSGDSLVDCLAAPDTALAGYVVEEVLASMPPAVARLVRDTSTFSPVSADLCRALGHRGAVRAVDLLAGTGVLQPADSGGRYRAVPVVAAVARQLRRRDRTATLARAAADWYAEHGPPLAAARAAHEAGDPISCARILAERGEEILAGGETSGFIELAAALPGSAHTERLRLLWGDALRAAGATAAALTCFSALAMAQPGGSGSEPGSWDPGLAWRMGMVYYLKAEPRTALEILARGGRGRPSDEALVSAWTATAHWMLGDVAAATEHARAALDRAAAASDDRALAAAHIAMAMALKLNGDVAGTDEQYGHALRVARRAGDVVQQIRILVNQAHEHLSRAQYPQALDVAATAVSLAGAGGPAGIRIVAACNEAEALGRVGRFDEAVERYRDILPACQQMGSHRTATVLAGLGDLHRRRGWPEQARAAYEEAIRIARVSGEAQTLVPALTGLARVVALTDPTAAAALVDEAADRAQGAFEVAVQVAQGWIALARGDRAAATDLAERAAKDARSRREPAWLAETLELRAAAEEQPRALRDALTEALTIWRDAGATIDADRVLATMDAIPDASTEDRVAAMMARQRQAAAGVRGDAVTVPLAFGAAAPIWVHIQTFGRFDVRVRGNPVPPTAWQSRKARDLLRILVARRIITRDELAELLWPEDDPARTGHRLSVLLSLVRTVLDPDRSGPVDQYVVADRSGIALDRTRVRIDVEEFLADVAHGCRLYEQGALAEARSALAAAVRTYAGEPFADDPYPDWTSGLQERARAARLRAQRTLARLARRAGDTDEALGHLLSILEHDPYDEDAHRARIATLVAAGRHGEARRAHTRYVDAMRSIGAPRPDDSVLSSRAAPPAPGESAVTGAE